MSDSIEDVSGTTRPSPPVIGVIMAAHNAEKYIAQALGSLTAQTYAHWECIVVDDASTDATAAVAAAAASTDNRIQVLSQPWGGVSVARNTGLAALAPSDRYVAFLDSDDTYLPDALHSLLQALQRRDDAVGVFGLAEYMDEDGTPIRPGEHSAIQLARRAVHNKTMIDLDRDADSTFADISVNGAIWPSAVALHRRSVLEAVGNFDVSFTHQGDWELYIRMSRNGPYAVLHQQVSWYRRHSANLTGDAIEACYQQERVRYKTWTTAGNTPEQRRIVARGTQRLRLSRLRKTLFRVPGHVATRDLPALAGDVRSVVAVATTLLMPGPPTPNRTRVRWTEVETTGSLTNR